MYNAGSRGVRSLISGIVLLAAGLFGMVSLSSGNSGALGRSLRGLLVWMLGRAAWLAPLLLVIVAVRAFRPAFFRRWGLAQFAGIGLALGSGLVMAHLLLVAPPPGETRPLLPPLSYQPGEPAVAVPRPLASGTGAAGALLAWLVQVAVGRAGAWILLPAVFLVGLFLLVEPYESRFTVVKRWLRGAFRLLGRTGLAVWGWIIACLRYVQDGLARWQDSREERKAWKGASRAERVPKPGTSRRVRESGGRDDDEDTLEFAVPQSSADEPADKNEKDGSAGKEGGLPLQRPLFPPPVGGQAGLPTGVAGTTPASGATPGTGMPRLELEGAAGARRNRHGIPLVRSFQLPPAALLTRPARNNRGRKEVPLDQSDLLVETFRNFGIQATVVAVHRGPTVTRYELQPAPGVKVSRIVGLADDIALALAAPGIRIEAPIPGKRAVGIEVPNPEPETVYFRDVIESEAFQKSPSPLTLAIGKDLGGEPVVADLRKMIHLLIAGATGSGKSVCLNALIASILCKASPAEVRLLMIDPKRVELSTFDGIAHLITPVVTDPKQAAVALRWAVREMEERYELFALAGVRNIEGFNEALLRGQLRVVHGETNLPAQAGTGTAAGDAGQPAAGKAGPAGRAGVLETEGAVAAAAMGEGSGMAGPAVQDAAAGVVAGQTVIPAPVFPGRKPRGRRQEEGDEQNPEAIFPQAPLPYLVIIIDELADLMLVAAAEVEDAIWRLAQMARAAGIYLIIATQRPSVDVITGVIKANIPSRIAFAVSSQTDSRVILDQAGAERLLGRGDMLFFPIGASKPLRAQGALIFDRDVERLVEFWKRQGEPEYELDVTVPVADEETAPGEPDDPLFDEAVRLVVEMGQASISLLQRRFRIGYSRAARLVDMMEQRGIIGPAQGSKPREILVGQRLGRTGESTRS